VLFLAAAVPGGTGVRFTDVTAQAGIHFTHNAGKAGRKYLPETMGAGCAFFDADGDGWLDILLVNSRLDAARPQVTRTLYRNNHNGTFTDITAGRDSRSKSMGWASAWRTMTTMAATIFTSRRSTAIVCSTTKAAESFAT